MSAPSAAPSPSDVTPSDSTSAARAKHTSPRTSARGRAARVGALAGVVAALVVSGMPLCPFAFLSGIPCPGCGLTRAGLCLLRGDVGAAITLSPLSPIVVPFVALIVARGFWTYLRDIPEVPPRWVTRGAIALWALLIVVWALRFAGLFGGPVFVESAWS